MHKGDSACIAESQVEMHAGLCPLGWREGLLRCQPFHRHLPLTVPPPLLLLQDLQRDIEQHSAGVESVFNICDVLLHDSDACANETECDSIQQTTRSLDRRWRNICAMSMERRMK